MNTKIKCLVKVVFDYLGRMLSDGKDPSLGRHITAFLCICGVVLLFKGQGKEGIECILSGIGAKTLQNFTERGGN